MIFDPDGAELAFPRRARVHVVTASAGMLSIAASSLSPLAPVRVDDWTRGSSAAALLVFAGVAATASAIGRGGRRAPTLDSWCTALSCVAAAALGQRMDASGVWLSALLPVFVVVHCLTGGARSGLLSFSSGVVVTLATAVDGHADIPRLLAELGACASALWIGRESMRRRGPAAGRRDDVPRRGAPEILDGKYRLGATLGEGGMGTVYESERLSDGAVVAVKVLHAHLCEVSKAVARFRREIDVARQIPAAHTARTFDCGTTQAGTEYIVMERLLGQDLSARLSRVRRLPPGDVARIVEQVSRGLSAAAALGVVHRDVKPTNIFLVQHEDGRVDARLLDFGLCCLKDGAAGTPLTGAQVFVGTPAFAAPELVSDAFGAPGPHTDVFSLASVAYEALSGQPAFPGRDPAEVVLSLLNYEPRALREVAPELPETLDWVLAIAFAKIPAHRYSGAEEFARDFTLAVKGETSDRVRARASAVGALSQMTSQTVTS